MFNEKKYIKFEWHCRIVIQEDGAQVRVTKKKMKWDYIFIELWVLIENFYQRRHVFCVCVILPTIVEINKCNLFISHAFNSLSETRKYWFCVALRLIDVGPIANNSSCLGNMYVTHTYTYTYRNDGFVREWYCLLVVHRLDHKYLHT